MFRAVVAVRAIAFDTLILKSVVACEAICDEPKIEILGRFSYMDCTVTADGHSKCLEPLIRKMDA